MISTNVKPLTDKVVQIQTATFLNAIAAKTKKQIIVYTLVDADTNKDGKINQNDIKSLYLSTSSVFMDKANLIKGLSIANLVTIIV